MVNVINSTWFTLLSYLGWAYIGFKIGRLNVGPEARIQKAVVDYAKREYPTKLIARKVQAGRFGTNGWPDYEFNVAGGGTFFIEFKAPGERPTQLQEHRIGELTRLGFRVHIVDDAEEGKRVIVNEMRRR